MRCEKEVSGGILECFSSETLLFTNNHSYDRPSIGDQTHEGDIVDALTGLAVCWGCAIHPPRKGLRVMNCILG